MGILIQGFAPRMARPSLALLVILFCGNIHEGLNQPLLDKTSMEELMRDMLKRQEEEVVNNNINNNQMTKRWCNNKKNKNIATGLLTLKNKSRMTKRWYKR